MASALPYVDRRVVFEPPVRFSAAITWEDLDDFCAKDATWRERFFEQYRINWTIVADAKVVRPSEKTFREPRFCKWTLSLADLGFKFPPVLVDGKFALFSRHESGKLAMQ
jgi:hypothetical protein